MIRSPALQTIDKMLPLLSHEEQLWLIEHLARTMRTKTQRQEWIDSLEEMANAPQIQVEIRNINEEFSITDGDGLDL